MKRLTLSHVALSALLLAPACGEEDVLGSASSLEVHYESVGEREFFVQYHTWYRRPPACPSGLGKWSHWHWGGTQDDPCSTPYAGAPWLRQLSAPSYPLIGPYSGLNAEVFRYHIQLAKAAGLDGFFVSIFAGIESSRDAFRTALRVADEEDFKIGIEGWQPPESGAATLWYQDDVISQLEEFAEQSPHASAFLHIKGKPAYWFNFHRRWLPTPSLITFLRRFDATWVVASNLGNSDIRSINQQLNPSEVQQMVNFNGPDTGGWNHNNRFVDDLRSKRGAGLLAMGHAYPGFDERIIAAGGEPGRPNRTGSRRDGAELRDFLDRAIDQGNADVILLESFNDWNESTNIEPGFDIQDYRNAGQESIYDGDPYRYLRIFADRTLGPGQFSAPRIPCAAVDPLLQAQGVTPCESAGGSPRKKVSVVFREADAERGLRRPTPEPGLASTLHERVRKCTGKRVWLRSPNPAVDSRARFIYLDVDDAFIFGGNWPTVEIQVQFWDHGNGHLELKYDSLGNRFRLAGRFPLTGTDCIRTAVFQLEDARFRNRQKGVADLRLGGAPGNDRIRVKRVKVIKR